MTANDTDQFRRRCAQLRWVMLFMVFSVGAMIVMIHLAGVISLWRGAPLPPESGPSVLVALIYRLPDICYLAGVWAISQGLGQLARGQLFHPTVARALRRVGVALWLGGVLSVFVVLNLLRLLGTITGGYLNFDVAGMTLGVVGAALFLLGGLIDQAGRIEAELDEMI